MCSNTRYAKSRSQHASDSPVRELHSLTEPFMEIIDFALAVRDIEVLRIAQVSKKTGQAASTVWLATKEKLFPPPIKLSERSVAWISAEVNAVLAARILASRSGVKLDMRKFVALLIAPRL
jgi:predicted DNA-binding transcriptional regulator AlpA